MPTDLPTMPLALRSRLRAVRTSRRLVPALIPTAVLSLALVGCPDDELIPGFTTLDLPLQDPNIVGKICSGGTWTSNRAVTPAREKYPSLATLVRANSSADSAAVEAGFTKYLKTKLGASASNVQTATLQGLSVIKAAATSGSLAAGEQIVTEAVAANSIILTTGEQIDASLEAGLTAQLTKVTGVSGQLSLDVQRKTATFATGTDLVIAVRTARVGNVYTTRQRPQIEVRDSEGSSERYTVSVSKIDADQWKSNGLGAESEACVFVWLQDARVVEQGIPLRRSVLYCPQASRIEGAPLSARYDPKADFQRTRDRPILQGYGANFETVLIDVSDLKLTYSGTRKVKIDTNQEIDALAFASAKGTVRLRIEGFPLSVVPAKCP